MTKAVEEVAASLVREYLSRKGLKKTLMCIDDELPRTDSSINNRTDLRQILHLEALYKKNKLQEFPLKSMLEMMVKEHMGNDGNMSPNYSNEQQTFLKKSHSAVLCKVHDVSDDEKNKHRTGNNPDLLQHKQFLAQTSETYHTKQQKASLSCSLTSEGEQNTHQVSLSPEICSISSNAAQSLKNNTTDIRKNRTSHIMRGMMAGPTASFKQECHKKKETRKFCGSSLPETKDEVSKFDMTLSAELSITEVREYPAQLALGGTSKKQESTQENGRLPGLSADATHIHEKLLSNFEKLNTDDRNNRPQMKKCWAKKEIPTPGPKALSLHLKADLMLDDFNDEEDLHEMFAGPVISCNLQTKADLHPIDQKTAVALKELLFGSQLSCFNEEWKAQSFTFSDVHDLRYGIEQKKGGPCGVLASIQACVLQKLLFDGTSSGSGYQKLHPSDAARSKSLLLAIAEILWRSGERKRATVALFSGRKQFVPAGKYKSDGVLETITLIHVNNFEDLKLYLEQHIHQFESGPYGCILLTVSAVLSRSFEMVRADFDMPTNSLIGAHGYCTQELVNLLLCGQAVSNVFDDNFELDSGNGNLTILKGIKDHSDIGFLSLFEHYSICKVGTYLKTPRFPIWVVCSESHFSVLFSTHKELITDWAVEKKFDLYYYDGLANQQEEIRLTISTGSTKNGSEDVHMDLTPPLDLCIRTKWKDALVDWNETEPIL